VNIKLPYEVPRYSPYEFYPKQKSYCLLIPIINEGDRILQELKRAFDSKIHTHCDVVLCDGGSTDGSLQAEQLKNYGVNTLLIKKDGGKQSAQLRMGFSWALERGYKGFITIDGNNKDSIEDVPRFIQELEEGSDFVQGSRYIKGGNAVNTPCFRHISVKLIHAPIISISAGRRFTDSTNAFRAYSERYLIHPEVQPFREVFQTYELLAYLSVRASQIGLKVKEIPVTRAYPKKGKTPTKISPFKGNILLLIILVKNLLRCFHPRKGV
jgi:dolichol-phosphate mannosyltransferase